MKQLFFLVCAAVLIFSSANVANASVISLVGDKDGFGITGAPAIPVDGSLFRDIGGVPGTDYRDPADLASAPFTDYWYYEQEPSPNPLSSPISYTHSYIFDGIPISATLSIQEAGMSNDRGPWEVWFNSFSIGYIGVFSSSASTEINLLDFLVPTSYLTGNDSIRLVYNDNLGEGFAINYSELNITTAVPEPSTFLLLGAGLAGLVFVARRRRKE